MKKLITEFYGRNMFIINKIDKLILEYNVEENPLDLNIFTGELEEEKTGYINFIFKYIK